MEAVQALSGALRLRPHERRHRPDARRHHRRFDRQGVRPADRRRPARGRPPAAVLEGARHRAERSAAAHGAHPGGRAAHPELGLGGAWLRREERLRHGRRAVDHAGDDGRGGEDAAGRAPVFSETIEAHRGEGDIARAGRGGAEGVSAASGSAPIPTTTARASRRGWCCARATRRRLRRRARPWTRRSKTHRGLPQQRHRTTLAGVGDRA